MIQVKKLNTLLKVFLTIFGLDILISCDLSPQQASIGGIEIGTDSIRAVTLIEKRLKTLKGNENFTIEKDDNGIGYVYFNNLESFHVKLENHKVVEIIFHSNILDDDEVVIVHDGNKISKDTTFTYEGNELIANFDYINKTYHLRKK
jgi:hypothetical protein